MPLCVEGTQGVGFLRALNTKSGQEPEEYWCAVQACLLYTSSRAADTPKKENDHAMDDIRYFVAQLEEEEDFWATAAVRR